MGDLINESIDYLAEGQILEIDDDYPFDHLDGEVHDSLSELIPYQPVAVSRNVTATLPKGNIDMGTVYVNESVTKSFRITANVTRPVPLTTNYEELTLSKSVLTPEELKHGAVIEVTFTPTANSEIRFYDPIIGFSNELSGLRVAFDVNAIDDPFLDSLSIKPSLVKVSMMNDAKGPLERIITVTGAGLRKDLVLSCSSDKIKLTPSVITPEMLNETQEVHVRLEIHSDKVGTHNYFITNNLTDESVRVESQIIARPEFNIQHSSLPTRILAETTAEAVALVRMANMTTGVILTPINMVNCRVKLNGMSSVIIPKYETEYSVNISVVPLEPGVVSFSILNDFTDTTIDFESTAYLNPRMSIEPLELDLGTAEVGRSITGSIKFTTQYFTSDVILTSSDDSGTLSTNTITASEDHKVTDVVVTIDPKLGHNTIVITNSFNTAKVRLSYFGVEVGSMTYDPAESYAAGTEVYYNNEKYVATTDILPGYAPGNNELLLGNEQLTLGTDALVIRSNWLRI